MNAYQDYIFAQQLYCRTSIAMYENLIAMNDEFGGDKDYWRSLFQNRIDMLAVSLYQLTTLQDDGVNNCLPLELKSFSSKATDPSSLVTDAYDDILTMYHTSISCSWTNCDGNGWENVGDPDNACYILWHYEKERSLSEVGYCLLDINNDGQSELIISLLDVPGSDVFPDLYAGTFYDMYTIVDGEIIHVVSAGERDHYNLAEDYSINNSGSSGAANSSNINYRLDSSNGTLKVNQAVIYDGWRDSENPYFYATTDYYNDETYEINYDVLKHLSNDEASALLESFPENTTLELIPFENYRVSSNQPDNDKLIVGGIYTQVDNEYNILEIKNVDEDSITFTAFWYRIWDIYEAQAVLNGNTATFTYVSPANESIYAAGYIEFQEGYALLTLTECTQPYVETGEYRFKLTEPQTLDLQPRKLTGIKEYDGDGALTADYTFDYDGDFLVGITSRTYGDHPYESNVDLSYDDEGRLVSRISINPHGQGTNSGEEYTYSNDGHLLHAYLWMSDGGDDWSGGAGVEVYEYDSSGKLIRMAEDYDFYSSITDYIYNEHGMLERAVTSITDESGGSHTETTAYSYDAQGRLIKEFITGGYDDIAKIYSYSFEPFVVLEYRMVNSGYSQFCALLEDEYGYLLHSFDFVNPRFYVDKEGYMVKAVDTVVDSDWMCTYEFYYDGIAAEVVGDDFLKEYTVEEIEQLVADYYNSYYQNEAYPGTYVVFHGETMVKDNVCTMAVRFQGDSNSATAANVLVAYVTVNLDTGIMTIDENGRNVNVQLFSGRSLAT